MLEFVCSKFYISTFQNRPEQLTFVKNAQSSVYNYFGLLPFFFEFSQQYYEQYADLQLLKILENASSDAFDFKSFFCLKSMGL